jgi:hypothetical protein
MYVCMCVCVCVCVYVLYIYINTTNEALTSTQREFAISYRAFSACRIRAKLVLSKASKES